VRDRTDKSNILTKTDISWIHEQTDEKITVIKGKIENFGQKSLQLDGRISLLENYMANEKPIITTVETAILAWKDHLTVELT
jgi:hypothetical protein